MFCARLILRKNRMPTRAGTGKVSVGLRSSGVVIPSGPHPGEQDESHDPESDTGNPGRDVRRDDPLGSKPLGELHGEKEYHSRPKADSHTVRGAAALVAR